MRNFMRLVWTGVFTSFLVGITLLGYVDNIRIFTFSSFAVTIYGVITVLHVCMQMTFALLNRGKINQLVARCYNEAFAPAMNLMSVGYREDLQLLRRHFLSLRDVQYPVRTYMFVSDGNDTNADHAMATVFREVFPQGTVLMLPFVLYEATDDQRRWLYHTISHANSTQWCILQPHRDKRHAMYTAMRLLCDLLPAAGIVTTDSDTVLDRDAVQRLAQPFVDLRIGAVTGNVNIDNVVNWLSALSAARYWFAFNLERAAQSYWGVVNCVSGPLGAYRTDVIRNVLEDWIRQTFLGGRCTFGDDRHLTNLTLRDGWRVVYTPLASCSTETPTEVSRWLRQQIRWNRSFYREMIFNFQWAYKHPLWLTYDMAYQTIFPVILLLGIFLQFGYVMHLHSFLPLLVFLLSVIIGGLFRSLYGFLLTGDVSKFLLTFYGLLYIVFLLPARIWAFLTIWHTQWGTSARGMGTPTPPLAARQVNY